MAVIGMVADGTIRALKPIGSSGTARFQGIESVMRILEFSYAKKAGK
jgi:hypothetical protein